MEGAPMELEIEQALTQLPLPIRYQLTLQHQGLQQVR